MQGLDPLLDRLLLAHRENKAFAKNDIPSRIA
jgi:hypothetical protein